MDIEKKPGEIIRIEKREFKGYDFIDIRVYFKNDNDQWQATKKGISIPPHLLMPVITGLKQLVEGGGEKDMTKNKVKNETTNLFSAEENG